MSLQVKTMDTHGPTWTTTWVGDVSVRRVEATSTMGVGTRTVLESGCPGTTGHRDSTHETGETTPEDEA